MEVSSIVIELRGKFDVSRLEAMNYHEAEGVWYFDGVMHHYEFRKVSTYGVRVTITAKHGGRPLYHQITFSNMAGWVRECVDAIDLEKGR